MNLHGAKPVSDTAIKEFILGLQPTKDLYCENIQGNFVKNFFNWISSSKLNNLTGLDNFVNKKLVAGTAQAFDHFYWRHKTKRFRFYNGEFMYHNAVLKHGGSWEYINNSSLLANDAVILSVPFSDYGSQHANTKNLLDRCTELEIPVLLDFAYYPCTKNINLNLDLYPTIETITFSISKAFYGAEFLRVGIRLERKDTDDGIDVFNSVDMVNRISISVANELIKKYSIDHSWNQYSDLYYNVCKTLGLSPTDCIMFGLGDDKWKEYNRGNTVNRVCISNLIGEELNDNDK